MGANASRAGGKVQVRRGVREDVPRIVQILVEAREAAQWSTSGMEEVLASHSRYFLIAEVGEDAVGFVSGRGMGQEAEILNLAVKQANRGQGIGRTLVEELLKILRKDGSEAVFLEVRESNTRAKAFYRALRFEEAGRREGYYRQPEEAAVVMRAKLHSEVRRVTIE